MDRTAFIMHQCHGCNSDTHLEENLAVAKLKAIVTQRCSYEGVEFDVEADCRFYFCSKKVGGRWGARLVRHWYEKSLDHPLEPRKNPIS